MNKTITQQLRENMAAIQVQVEKTVALISALELQTAALIGGITGETAPNPTKAKAPAVKKTAKAPQKAAATTPGAIPLSDLIKQAATALARSNSKKQVRVEEVLALLKTQGSKLDMQKPNSVIGVTLSRTPGFSRVSSGLYLYQPRKSEGSKSKPEKASKTPAAAAAPTPPGDDEVEEKCPNCDNLKSQCICQRVQSAMPPLSE